MMYRVGFQCVSESQAYDLVLSSLPPFYMPDGSLARPYLNNEVWMYNGKPVVLDFPACDPVSQIGDGAWFGGQLLILMVIAFGFRQIFGLIRNVGGIEGAD